MSEMIKVKPAQMTVVKCPKKKCVGSVVLHESVAGGWLVGSCGKCGTKHCVKGKLK